jgi:small nuclear ribonucleoprotein (snRNP)-like protein
VGVTSVQYISVLEDLKGKNVEIKVRELSTMIGKLIKFDDNYIVIQVTENVKGRQVVSTYYIPHYNIIYITPT